MHIAGEKWTFTLTLDMHMRVCQTNRFLFHINCNTIVSNKCSLTTLSSTAKLIFLTSPLHQHHLSTNKSGHFQTSWLLFARLYNHSLLTMCVCNAAHKDNNMNPIQASCYLSLTTYIGRHRGRHALASS